MKEKDSKFSFRVIASAALCFLMSCKQNAQSEPNGPLFVDPPAKSGVEFWLTKRDKTVLLEKQKNTLVFKSGTNSNPTIQVDAREKFQTVDGFGYTLTGGTATLINALEPSRKDALMRELFSLQGNGIGVNYIRISIGASDMSAEPFTYDDLPDGQTDLNLEHFSLAKERADLLPILKKMVAINPKIKILGSPWTAPKWMKTNNSFKGGSLKPEYYEVYASYFVKYVQAMQAEGIPIDAITIQNEPLHPGNNPSMYMEARDQADFVKNHLGPAFQKANIATKIIIYDHNLDKPEYATSILDDPQAKKYIDGSAFHLYAGDINTMSKVHFAHPDKNVYFTEQWTGGPGNFAEDLKWHVGTLVIGATRNWSRTVLEWNLAADPNYMPHTDQGGCTSCLGALTIGGQAISRNSAYYVIGHASKFVPSGSTRIGTNVPGTLQNVAFETPEGKKVLIVVNSGSSPQSFNIKSDGKIVSATLDQGAVGTFVW